MMTTIDWNAELLRVTRRALLMVGMVAASGVAAAQQGLPDAQVEANVLKALASAPDLANESITTKTVYGTVTLSGSVSGEPARVKAETLAANANGVKKVVDELQIGSATSAASAGGPGMVLMSDGTYGPAPSSDETVAQESAQTQSVPNRTGQTASPTPGSASAEMAQRNNPDADQALDQQMEQQQGQNSTAQNAAPQGQNSAVQQQPSQAQQPNQAPQNQQTANQGPYARRPMYGYPGYAPYGYPPQGAPQAGYAQQGPGYGQQAPPMGGQVAGQPVTVPSGALLRVRINRALRSDKTAPGTTFDGQVVNDVVANGLVAIPRGATVQGTVIDAKGSGALTGRGEMSIQLTQVTLGGKNYPLVSDVWAHNGGGVGAAAGLGSSAASGRGQVFIPAEAIVTFHTAQPASVATVSEQEMQRLAYGVPAGATQAPPPRGYRAYPGYYPGAYPPGYYPPYGYPNY